MSSFSDKLTGMLNASAASTALGVASRTGLLAALDTQPTTAAALAAKAGLAERYVTEILAALVCGDVVLLGEKTARSVDPDGAETLTYSLPADRKEALDGMGLYFEEMPLLAQCSFDQVCAAAKTGDGVPAASYSAFGAWMGRLGDEKHARQLTQTFLPALEGGAVVAALQRGARVMDLGCGEGAAARLIAAAFPSAKITGIDIDAASIAAAQAQSAGQDNLDFMVGDASALTAAGTPGAASRRRDRHSAAPPSPFSRRYNIDDGGVSAK